MTSLPRELFERLKRNVQFFSGFSDEELLSFLRLMKSEKFKDGEVIFKEGETGDKMYILLKGQVQIIKRGGKIVGGGHQETLLATLEAGECFGEMGMIDRRARSATARSSGDSFLFSMAENTIYRISINPKYASLSSKLFRNFAIMLARRLREINQKYVNTMSDSPEQLG